MSKFSLFYNFRVRLLLVLAGLLLATLAVQYFIERRAQGRTAHFLAEQEQALARLTVSRAREDGFAGVRISDTGSGVPAENIGHIFEPYFSTKETGTGLGLAIARKAAEDHGGTVSVESSHGAGTTFTVLIPAVGKYE